MGNLKQIAKDLGVSPATVSNAISGKGRVSAALADRIRQRADEVGYRPSLTARALKTGRSGILGLVMPDLTNPLFPKLAQSIETAADAAGFGVLIADSRGDAAGQAAAIRRLQQRGVDGIVIVPHRGTRPEPLQLPMAVINTVSDPLNTVSSDHMGGGRLVARAMLDMGHRNFVLVGGDKSSQVQTDRIAGMHEILMGAAQMDVVWYSSKPPNFTALVASGVTAALTTSDLIALRVLSAAQQEGIVVPRQLSVTGFDDLPLGTAVRPMLSTLSQNVEAIAAHAIAFLNSKLTLDGGVSEGRLVPMKLVLRQSSAAPVKPL